MNKGILVSNLEYIDDDILFCKLEKSILANINMVTIASATINDVLVEAMKIDIIYTVFIEYLEKKYMKFSIDSYTLKELIFKSSRVYVDFMAHNKIQDFEYMYLRKIDLYKNGVIVLDIKYSKQI